MQAISDARNTHLSTVMGGREANYLLDALITDPDFIFVTNIESFIAILKGIYKPHRPKGSGTSRNDEHARKKAIIRNSLKKKKNSFLLNFM